MKKGTLIILSGLPGSGKSTSAEKLKVERNAILLWPDYYAKALVKDIQDKEEYHRIRTKVKDLLFEMMQQLLQVGATVIIERGFYKREERNKYVNLARELQANVELYFFDIPFQTLWERLEKRNKLLPDGALPVSFEELKHWSGSFEVPNEEELKMYDKWKIIKP